MASLLLHTIGRLPINSTGKSVTPTNIASNPFTELVHAKKKYSPKVNVIPCYSFTSSTHAPTFTNSTHTQRYCALYSVPTTRYSQLSQHLRTPLFTFLDLKLYATMLSFMKKSNCKADKCTITHFSNHTIAVVYPNYSVSHPSTFEVRHKFSAVQSQPALVSQYFSSSNGTALTDACTEPSVTAFADLPPQAGPQKYHKVKSFLLDRPDVVSTEAGQERHGKWYKTKKAVIFFQVQSERDCHRCVPLYRRTRL
jgi:hypothetical protein